MCAKQLLACKLPRASSARKHGMTLLHTKGLSYLVTLRDGFRNIWKMTITSKALSPSKILAVSLRRGFFLFTYILLLR